MYQSEQRANIDVIGAKYCEAYDVMPQLPRALGITPRYPQPNEKEKQPPTYSAALSTAQ
jgi:hypothetical protein